MSDEGFGRCAICGDIVGESQLHAEYLTYTDRSKMRVYLCGNCSHDLLSELRRKQKIAQVENPDYYTTDGKECIEVINDFLHHVEDPYCAFCTGNILKYLWRFKSKGGSQDLIKARRYLDFLLDVTEEQETCQNS